MYHYKGIPVHVVEPAGKTVTYTKRWRRRGIGRWDKIVTRKKLLPFLVVTELRGRKIVIANKPGLRILHTSGM